MIPLSPRREPLLDALRALAMVGVLVVNALSYPVAPWGAPLGELDPPGIATFGAHALAALLLHGKAYPLLAFLFGAGLVLAVRRRGAPSDGRARLRRLLLLGVLHGALVYCGDILTMYAVCGFTVLAHAGDRPTALYRRWIAACAWAAGAVLLSLLLAVYAGPSGVADPSDGFGAVTSWVEQAWLNVTAYATLQVAALVLFLPVLRAAMLAGMLAARLRLLTHRRWRPSWQRWSWRLLPAGLLLNSVYALGMTDAMAQRDPAVSLWLALAPAVGWSLTVPLVGLAVLHAGRWASLLAPLGRRTLSLYLLHSMLCVALFSGAGAGWPLSILGGWAWSLGMWLAAWGLSAWAESRGWRGPFEPWLVHR
ncbi:DUF418 domain-containing protein [Aquincola sp. MAHUQ-54]|uniref:DUF418 domain-containing protein n=1 Tax=Aquincola agrisoli TaxID=3119538 RepID=A0AAW9QDD3_9BURK